MYAKRPIMLQMATKDDKNAAMFGFRIDPEVRRKLRIWSIQHDVAVAEIVRGLIEILLDEQDELGAKLRERLTRG